jgi:hypothetical protein
MTNTTVHRSIAVLKLPGQIALIISIAKTIVLAMTGNKAFLNPQPTLAVISAAIADLENAEAAAQSRTKGAVALRNEKRTTVVKLLEQLRGYVQTVADADPPHGAALIGSAGMNVKRVTARGKRVFAVAQGDVTGTVTLTAPATRGPASYEWEVSTDGGKTWQMLPPTLRSRAVVTGLQAGVEHAFRTRTVTKTGATNWSALITRIVL